MYQKQIIELINRQIHKLRTKDYIKARRTVKGNVTDTKVLKPFHELWNIPSAGNEELTGLNGRAKLNQNTTANINATWAYSKRAENPSMPANRAKYHGGRHHSGNYGALHHTATGKTHPDYIKPEFSKKGGN